MDTDDLTALNIAPGERLLVTHEGATLPVVVLACKTNGVRLGFAATGTTFRVHRERTLRQIRDELRGLES